MYTVVVSFTNSTSTTYSRVKQIALANDVWTLVTDVAPTTNIAAYDTYVRLQKSTVSSMTITHV